METAALHPIVLFRPPSGPDDPEERVAQRYLSLTRQRTSIGNGSLVIGRYSVLPFYRELERDLANVGSGLINTAEQHEFIADVWAWAPILGEDLTPKTWPDLYSCPDDGTSFVVKGQTNSRKDRWSTHMFAKDRQAAVGVTMRLNDDGLIGSQRLVYRRYEPLKQWNDHTSIGGCPISEEFRLFLLDGDIIADGFYWSSHVERTNTVAPPRIERKHFGAAKLAVERLRHAGKLPRFLVIDVATRADGSAMVVELNDGQMSGLSECDPHELYAELAERLS